MAKLHNFSASFCPSYNFSSSICPRLRFFSQDVEPSCCCYILEFHCQEKLQRDMVQLLGVTKSTVSKAIHRFRKLGRGEKLPCQYGRIRKIIEKRVFSNSRVSMRKIIRYISGSLTPVHRMAKNEFALKRYRSHKVQHLMDKSEREQLPERAAGGGWERVLFTNEMVFTLQQARNRQNDRMCSTNSTVTPPMSSIVKIRRRSWFEEESIATERPPGFCVEEEVKMIQDAYSRKILETVVVTWPSSISAVWMIQQDSSLTHREKIT